MQQMLHELTPFITDYGLWVIFLGMMIEGTSMIILTGLLCYLGMLSFKEALPIAILGAIISDQFWYFMGNQYASKWIEKFSNFKRKIYKLKDSVQTKGKWFALGGRFIYGGAILFPLTLGTYHYPYRKFTLLDIIGVCCWSLVGISLGYLLGSGAETITGKLEKVWHLVLLLLIGLLLIKVIKYALALKTVRR